MTESSTVLFASILLVVVLGAAALAAWRLRQHAARRADAERRMTEALAELQRLTTRLRAQQAEIAATAAALAERRGGGPSAGGGA
jgi:predicted negative regulator of RcsB-dependent stress response